MYKISYLYDGVCTKAANHTQNSILVEALSLHEVCCCQGFWQAEQVFHSCYGYGLPEASATVYHSPPNYHQ